MTKSTTARIVATSVSAPIASFVNATGWGFIKMDDGSSVFLHCCHLARKGVRKLLAEGMELIFDLMDEGRPSLVAHNVRLNPAA